jgi:hypothetical protein
MSSSYVIVLGFRSQLLEKERQGTTPLLHLQSIPHFLTELSSLGPVPPDVASYSQGGNYGTIPAENGSSPFKLNLQYFQ